MTDASKILSYMHCRRCVELGKEIRISAGLIDSHTLRLWCDNHNILIADFHLSRPITPRCDICGEEVTSDHKH